jgi:16S rRNA (cytosine967-C5)-methyltransferase
LPELVVLQTELLTRSLTLLKPGGVLAYVTCSPVESETSGVISGVVATVEGVETIDTPAVLDRVARVVVPHTRRGTAVQLWTHLHGTDAMFVQLLRKTR